MCANEKQLQALEFNEEAQSMRKRVNGTENENNDTAELNEIYEKKQEPEQQNE